MQNTFVLFLLIALIGFPAKSSAQATVSHRTISAADSALISRYLDSVNVSSLFSQKRQRYFDSALAISPWRARWWQQKAMLLYKQKKYEAGAPFLDSAVKYDAKAYIDYRAFMKCIFQKSYRSAIQDFWAAKVIIGDGDVMDHTFDFYIGLCYLQLNVLDSAQYYLTKTTEDQKRTIGDKFVHPLDWFYLGIVYYEQENYTKAIEIFDNCLKLYTNFSDAKYYKAICLKRSHHDEAAFALMKEAGQDFKQGYTINEDNVIYENYPYQVAKPIYYEMMAKDYDTKTN